MKILGNQDIAGVVRVGRRVNEGFKNLLLTEDVQLTKMSEKFWKVATNLDEVSIKLPNATTISKGFEILFFSTTPGVTVLDFSGNKIQSLEQGTLYYLYLVTDGTEEGEWAVNVDTSFDIAVGEPDSPAKGVRSYFRVLYEYEGNIH